MPEFLDNWTQLSLWNEKYPPKKSTEHLEDIQASECQKIGIPDCLKDSYTCQQTSITQTQNNQWREEDKWLAS